MISNELLNEYRKLRAEMLNKCPELSNEIESIDTYSNIVLSDFLEIDPDFSEINSLRNVFELYHSYSNKKIPESFSSNANIRSSMMQFAIRSRIISDYSFCIVTKAWVKHLSDFFRDKKVLEIMSGSGMLAYAFKEQGIDVIATDNFEWGVSKNLSSWVDVENIDCTSAVKKYAKDSDIILCSWPPMDDSFFKACCLAREINPDIRILYIGERYGGCTASDNFFNNFIEITYSNSDVSLADLKFCSYPMIHDCIGLYK